MRKYGNAEKPILFVGMSATPYGMAQNGVPFGNTKHVKEYLNVPPLEIRLVMEKANYKIS